MQKRDQDKAERCVSSCGTHPKENKTAQKSHVVVYLWKMMGLAVQVFSGHMMEKNRAALQLVTGVDAFGHPCPG